LIRPKLPLLELRDFQFFDFVPCSLELKEGEVLGIQGASGSGKSLLLKAIADLVPNQGMAFYKGQAAEAFGSADWRKKIGYLPAVSAWWFDDVASHCSEWDTKGLEALGLDLDVLNWPVSRLSTGERQRLALVRLLSHSPSVLLLDEPTASLDTANRKLFEDLLERWLSVEQRAAIVVSHDPAQLERLATQQSVLKEKMLVSI